MPQPSPSPQPRKSSILVEARDDRPAYRIRSLANADQVWIQFAGQRYDLKNLTADELTHLLAHPQEVPYLQRA